MSAMTGSNSTGTRSRLAPDAIVPSGAGDSYGSRIGPPLGHLS